MKKILFLTLLFSLSFSYAQEEIFTHNKIPVKLDYTQLLGANTTTGWETQSFPTEIPYNGEMITVNYPQYLKPFSLFIKNQFVRGHFAIKYDRFQNTDYLMFQIYLYWNDQNVSWFIAKSYGENNTVNFYESNPDTETTMNPAIPTQMGGPYVWRIELKGFTPIIDTFYDNFLVSLKEETKQALIQALANHP